jgi:hypothetical protein
MYCAPVAKDVARGHGNIGCPVFHIIECDEIRSRIVDKNGRRISVGKLVQGFK